MLYVVVFSLDKQVVTMLAFSILVQDDPCDGLGVPVSPLVPAVKIKRDQPQYKTRIISISIYYQSEMKSR